MKLILSSYLTLTLLVGYLDAGRYRCDYTYSPIAQAWFKYHLPAIWTDARLMCTLEGGILASPTTPEIRRVLKKYAFNIPIFTGFHATVSRGKYYTVDGIPLEENINDWLLDYAEPEYEYHKGGCVAINSQGLFFDADCYKPRPYICYMSKMPEVNICGTTDPDYHLENRTNKCYKFHTEPGNFSRANFACSAEGGHLAIINSEVEANVLRDIFARNTHDKMIGKFWKDIAFIGFHDWGEQGDWRTIHGQTLQEAGYSQFKPGEPNNSTTGEYCGSIYRTGLLNDLWCNNHYAFICEKDPTFPVLCDSATPAPVIASKDSAEERGQEENQLDIRYEH